MFPHWIKAIVFCSCLLALVATTGCETESSEQISISVTPNVTSLSPGESQEFTASGWQDYTWEIAESGDNVGVLSTRKGETTTYTAASGTNDVVVLRVSANVRTRGTNDVDNSSSRPRAEAIITHRP